jgi:hypothetical protein
MLLHIPQVFLIFFLPLLYKTKCFFALFGCKSNIRTHWEQTKNGEPTLLVHCLYQMSPLNHKRTTSSLAAPIICVAKLISNKNIEGSPFTAFHTFAFEKYLFCCNLSLERKCADTQKKLSSSFNFFKRKTGIFLLLY